MAKIPYRPDPPFDHNAARKADQPINTSQQHSKVADSALFKNAIRLADERNQERANDATVRGGEKSANERMLELKNGGDQETEQATSKDLATLRAEVGKITKEQSDTKAALIKSSNQSPAETSSLLEQGLDEANVNSKKRSSTAEQDFQMIDAQNVQIANQPSLHAQTPGVFMSELPRRASQDMGHFESIQSAAKFLEKMNADTSDKAWRFSLPGDEFVKGVHMQQSKDGGWSITVASDEEHADTLNEQLDTLVGALEDAGMQVSNVAVS